MLQQYAFRLSMLAAQGNGRVAISQDGQRFLMLKAARGSTDTAEPPSIVVIQNWFEELKRLVPTN